ncbi:hypothetical protein AJ80_07797 [Polytolypa hystricis UAMH7299]|uniref:Uncharacterized protein n=1 Tax=Polytolypa hystricis (strain UAMH7299) TaxID=1447883 RepID=A0A2B7XIL7_POLH7|nr:hypothetical protein AJ80_07797 [Polytolypa hystricis UAMH7299]
MSLRMRISSNNTLKSIHHEQLYAQLKATGVFPRVSMTATSQGPQHTSTTLSISNDNDTELLLTRVAGGFEAKFNGLHSRSPKINNTAH